LVQLSRHNSKKYQAVLQLKISIAENPIALSASIISENSNDCNTAMDEFGETKAKSVRKPCKQLTSDETEAIVQGYRNGETIKALSEQFSCHRTTINRALKKYGIFTSIKTASLDHEKVIGMYHEMHTTKEIAKEFGVSPTTIVNYLRKHDIKTRSRWDYK
jgi:DNA invertase Pin-like site-specific DNA recombinase